MSQANEQNRKLNNGWFNKCLEIFVGKDLLTKLHKSENKQWHSEGKHCQQQREATATTNMKRGNIKILQYYTANETDEEKEHRQPMFQQNAINKIRNETDGDRQRWKFTVKITLFDTTIGSKNYTICQMHMRDIFPTDWGQPISLSTVLQ